MALKQLLLNKKIEQRKASLAEMLKNNEEYEKRSAELAAALEEASNEEETQIVEDEIDKLEAEFDGVSEKKLSLEEEIRSLEEELSKLNETPKPNNESRSIQKPNNSNTPIEGEERMKVNKFETRSQMLARLDIEEVRNFYTTVASAAKDKRALSGTDVLIPEQVVNMIQNRLGDYGTLYREVMVEQLNGTARIIMDGAIPEAIWVECCDPVEELATAFSQTELDCFKVGGFIPVCNATLEDSMINLANFLETRLAMAIAKAIDDAILNGEGAAQKQPMGIITELTANAPDQIVTSDGTLKDIMSKMALIDSGEDGPPIGEVIAVMKRSFYYSVIAPQTFLANDQGQYVIAGTSNPRLPDGTRIVFNQYTPDNTIVLGDFKKYLLGERRGVQLAVSTDVRFIQDQTVFKGTARYDGKPIYDNKFVVINVTPPAVTG
ncbi:HK97 family phage major capsid protein [Cytobacillus firmus]|uniref:HK97 family phage major capsid protein n=2 Tax=Cytobacillus TaxID=2675230 RepID=A0A366JPT7_CYTFI|nr:MULTISPECIES: phage major capsid protein [Cytobacillus]RBP89392.1 HK97 family phage major capsid protein [Cytobacillus firmus]TDX47381.1 HK97 family phage major capsid protein [Cytobacillus oceanisediminis]